MSDTITVTGNVATAPQHKRTPNGVPITTFRVASGQRRYDRSTDAWVDAGTNFYSVSAFRGLADHAFQSLRRGERVVLTGRLRVRDWESGDKRGTDVEIDAEAIGHDLRWGTTTFVKDAVTAVPDKGESWAEPPAPDDAWSAPGVGAPVAEPAGGEAAPTPLASAGIETPF